MAVVVNGKEKVIESDPNDIDWEVLIDSVSVMATDQVRELVAETVKESPDSVWVPLTDCVSDSVREMERVSDPSESVRDCVSVTLKDCEDDRDLDNVRVRESVSVIS